ncbi:7776_t:CDS:2 [Paraglomus occultum]|uniref:7776_t:CDS:1 n=1 Tax=Paraglomus occultum TaxID=144539 RepID=A0A9N9CPD3_9GLOM|nr:7776_t:CDS:2 [Paraglomus occultum]
MAGLSTLFIKIFTFRRKRKRRNSLQTRNAPKRNFLSRSRSVHTNPVNDSTNQIYKDRTSDVSEVSIELVRLDTLPISSPITQPSTQRDTQYSDDYSYARLPPISVERASFSPSQEDSQEPTVSSPPRESQSVNDTDSVTLVKTPTASTSSTLLVTTPSTPTYRKGPWPISARPLSGRRDWRSGYKPIDKTIQAIRLEYPEPAHNLVWVPFEEFTNLRFVARGGFAAVYQATWLKTAQRIALKALDDSQDISEAFLESVKTHWELFSQPYFARLYGFTQLPDTGEFMLVIQYAPYGNLHVFCQRNQMSGWKDRVRILKCIAHGIAELHKKGLVHGDLHPGNILNIDGNRFVIGDVGTSGPANAMVRRKAMYGVLPYIAPEVLKGQEYTKRADIYSFAMIMWELAAGFRPYAGRPHDLFLAKEICDGLRPPVPAGTPKFYEDLMKACWDPNPRLRPDSQEILQTVFKWMLNDMVAASPRRDKVSRSVLSCLDEDIHSNAYYFSRLLQWPHLREGRETVASLMIPRTPAKSYYLPDERQSNYLNLPQHIYQFGFHGRALLGPEPKKSENADEPNSRRRKTDSQCGSGDLGT